MKILIFGLILIGFLYSSSLTLAFTENFDSAKIELTKLRLNDIRPTTFNEGQPIIFSGKLTTEFGEPIPKVEILIKSDSMCPPDGIIAKGITDKNGRFWIYTLAKNWDLNDNLIKAHAEFLGDGKFSSSVSRHETIVVFSISDNIC